MPKNYYTITESDVGRLIIEMKDQKCPVCHGSGKTTRKIYLGELLGVIYKNDVGKRIYVDSDGYAQIENQSQYEKRIGE